MSGECICGVGGGSSVNRTFLILLLIFVSGVLYLIPDKKNGLSVERGPEKINLFTSSCLDNLSRIQLIKGGSSQELVYSDSVKSDDILLRRSKWLLKQPLLAPANDEQVNYIISILRDLKGALDETAPSASLQGKYGLVPPEGVLILDCLGTKEVLSIGTKSEISENRYYQKEGEESLYLVQDKFIEFLELNLKDIRARKILAFDSSKIQNVDVVDGFKFYAMTREEDGSWTIASDGKKIKGDQSFIEGKLKDLVDISVSRIFENPIEILPLTGLEDPKLILTLKIKSGANPSELAELNLQFGRGVMGDVLKSSALVQKSNKQLYYLKIAKDNSIYELERSSIADWLQGANYFRARAPFALIDESTVSSATFEVNGISCGLDGRQILDIPELNEVFRKSLDLISFDAFIEPHELSKYVESKGLSAKLQFGTKIITATKVADVFSIDGSKDESVASVLNISEVGKESYYGSISSANMALIEGNFKDLCIKGKAK